MWEKWGESLFKFCFSPPLTDLFPGHFFTHMWGRRRDKAMGPGSFAAADEAFPGHNRRWNQTIRTEPLFSLAVIRILHNFGSTPSR